LGVYCTIRIASPLGEVGGVELNSATKGGATRRRED
jgi:hypothetical protein